MDCIPKGKVEPGYIYRKKMLPYDFIDPIKEAEDLFSVREGMVAEGKSKELIMDTLEAAGYGNSTTVYMKLTLLRLPKLVQKWVRDGRLRTSIGYRIYAIKDKETCIGLARRAITERLSCRKVESIMKEMKKRGVY